MVAGGPSSWLTVIAVGLWEAYRFSFAGKEVQPEINVYVPSPQPSESTCHCECVGLSSQGWSLDFLLSAPIQDLFLESWVWVILLICLLLSFLLVRLCSSIANFCHHVELSHASIQTYRPLLSNGHSQTLVRMTSVGVQTELLEPSAASGSLAIVSPASGPRGITTPQRRKQWQQPQEC